MAAQAIQRHLDRTGAHPVAIADQARLPRDRAVGVCDIDRDRGTPVRPLRSIVELHGKPQRMAGAALGAQLFGRYELPKIEVDHAALEDLVGAGMRRQARRQGSAGDALGHSERRTAGRELGQNDALQGLVVLGYDEIAQALPHFGLDWRQLGGEARLIGGAECQLGLELGECAWKPSLISPSMARPGMPASISSARLSPMPKEWKRFSRVTPVMPPSFRSRGMTCSSSMRRISRGTPGVKKKRALPMVTAKPHAVPIGLSMNSQFSGSMACFLLLAGITRPRRA